MHLRHVDVMGKALDLESEDCCEVSTLTLGLNSPKHPFTHAQDEQIGLHVLLSLRMLKEKDL